MGGWGDGGMVTGTNNQPKLSFRIKFSSIASTHHSAIICIILNIFSIYVVVCSRSSGGIVFNK